MTNITNLPDNCIARCCERLSPPDIIALHVALNLSLENRVHQLAWYMLKESPENQARIMDLCLKVANLIPQSDSDLSKLIEMLNQLTRNRFFFRQIGISQAFDVLSHIPNKTEFNLIACATAYLLHNLPKNPVNGSAIEFFGRHSPFDTFCNDHNIGTGMQLEACGKALSEALQANQADPFKDLFSQFPIPHQMLIWSIAIGALTPDQLDKIWCSPSIGPHAYFQLARTDRALPSLEEHRNLSRIIFSALVIASEEGSFDDILKILNHPECSLEVTADFFRSLCAECGPFNPRGIDTINFVKAHPKMSQAVVDETYTTHAPQWTKSICIALRPHPAIEQRIEEIDRVERYTRFGLCICEVSLLLGLIILAVVHQSLF